MTVSEKQEHARKVLAEIHKTGLYMDAVQVLQLALAAAEREGMMRAAEIAKAAGQCHLDFAAMGLPIEPSKIIAEDRSRVASRIADAILSQANTHSVALPPPGATEQAGTVSSSPVPATHHASRNGEGA